MDLRCARRLPHAPSLPFSPRGLPHRHRVSAQPLYRARTTKRCRTRRPSFAVATFPPPPSYGQNRGRRPRITHALARAGFGTRLHTPFADLPHAFTRTFERAPPFVSPRVRRFAYWTTPPFHGRCPSTVGLPGHGRVGFFWYATYAVAGHTSDFRLNSLPYTPLLCPGGCPAPRFPRLLRQTRFAPFCPIAPPYTPYAQRAARSSLRAFPLWLRLLFGALRPVYGRAGTFARMQDAPPPAPHGLVSRLLRHHSLGIRFVGCRITHTRRAPQTHFFCAHSHLTLCDVVHHPHHALRFTSFAFGYVPFFSSHAYVCTGFAVCQLPRSSYSRSASPPVLHPFYQHAARQRLNALRIHAVPRQHASYGTAFSCLAGHVALRDARLWHAEHGVSHAPIIFAFAVPAIVLRTPTAHRTVLVTSFMDHRCFDTPRGLGTFRFPSRTVLLAALLHVYWTFMHVSRTITHARIKLRLAFRTAPNVLHGQCRGFLSSFRARLPPPRSPFTLSFPKRRGCFFPANCPQRGRCHTGLV